MTVSKARRVAVLIDSLIGGGAERVAVQAAGALDRTRWLPHLVVTRAGGPLEELVRAAGIEYTILGRRRGFHPRAFREALRIVRSSDLLHAHKFAGSMWGALLARGARRPLVAHEHTFYGGASRMRTAGYRLWIAPTASRIVCVSADVAAALAQIGVPRRLLTVVANGVPVDVALPREQARLELGLDPEATIVGMVGRLRPEKRHELALSALARLRRDGRAVELCIVGDGPRDAELRALAASLGVAEHVAFAGEQPDAARLARAFDATLLCSSFEGMPLAALESLVAGTPVVATPVGALPELLAGGAGELVRADDPDAIARGLAAVLDRRSVPAPGLALARDRFGIERMAQELQRIYDEATAR